MMTDWEKNRFLRLFAEGDGRDLANGTIDLEEFIHRLDFALQEMVFRRFDTPLADALRDYCHFALVDPALIAAYIGQSVDTLDFQQVIDTVRARTISHE